MSKFVLVACLWLHSVAAVVWIGGIIFLVGIALPALRNHGGAETAVIMKSIGQRFTPLANASIALLLATGTLLLLLPEVSHGNSGHFLWGKMTVFAAMLAIHCWRIFALPGKVARVESETQRSRLQRVSLSLVKINLALGMVALLFTAAAGL